MKRYFILAVLMVLSISLLPHGVARAATAINNCTELQAMSSNLAETYTLASDIDCSATTSWNAGAGFEPVGTSVTPFTGTLDGQGHKIISLFINRPTTDDVGLFGSSQDASVSNLTMQDGSMTGQANVGSISGRIQSMSLSSVSSNIAITNTSRYAGGIIGYNESQSTFLSTLTEVHFSGSVNTPASSYGNAGLIGDNDADVDIIQSSNAGSISGGNVYIGGLVGDNDAVVNIIKSFNSGKVTGTGSTSSIGGLVGWSGDVNITDSYNTGDITGTDEVGGLIGTIGAITIVRSYSSGLITGVNSNSTGALIGAWSDLTMANSFWNAETTGQTVACGTGNPCTGDATGISSAQMRTQSTFTDATWDFEKVWGICEYFNNGFPYLLWQNPTCAAPTPGLPNTGLGSLGLGQFYSFLY